MKGLLAIAFSVFYLVFSTGLGINVHYCGDKVSSVELTAFEGPCCCGPMEAVMNCCSSETYVYQVAEEHHTTTSPEWVVPPMPILEFAEWETELEDTDFESHAWLDRGPPDPPKTPVYLRLCRLTYYG